MSWNEIVYFLPYEILTAASEDFDKTVAILRFKNWSEVFRRSIFVCYRIFAGLWPWIWKKCLENLWIIKCIACGAFGAIQEDSRSNSFSCISLLGRTSDILLKIKTWGWRRGLLMRYFWHVIFWTNLNLYSVLNHYCFKKLEFLKKNVWKSHFDLKIRSKCTSRPMRPLWPWKYFLELPGYENAVVEKRIFNLSPIEKSWSGHIGPLTSILDFHL